MQPDQSASAPPKQAHTSPTCRVDRGTASPATCGNTRGEEQHAKVPISTGSGRGTTPAGGLSVFRSQQRSGGPSPARPASSVTSESRSVKIAPGTASQYSGAWRTAMLAIADDWRRLHRPLAHVPCRRGLTSAVSERRTHHKRRKTPSAPVPAHTSPHRLVRDATQPWRLASRTSCRATWLEPRTYTRRPHHARRYGHMQYDGRRRVTCLVQRRRRGERRRCGGMRPGR
jgi:hypothetical protein